VSKIAILGTGLLGAAFAEAACKRGDAVTVWNRTGAKAKALERFGAVAAASPAEAVRGAERVHLVLPDDAVVEDVIAAFRSELAPGAIIVDHTTTQPAATAARSARLNAEGVSYLHCPVFIGPAAARDAQGTIMVSGPVALWERVRPALERQAAKVEYFGDRPDLAAIYKLVGNALILGITGLVSDVYSIAAASGVAPVDALKPLEFINPAGVIAGRGKKMAAGDFSASFELTMARKDVRLMMEAAGALPLAVPGMAARMDALIGQGYGGSDMGVMAREAVSARPGNGAHS
jgi:3-hydroxyisobutyrate dehydrogenase